METLSDKINWGDKYDIEKASIIGREAEDIDVEDVKEFIRELKEYCEDKRNQVKRINPIIMKCVIDKLAGDKLI